MFCDKDATEDEIVAIGDKIGKLDNIEKIERVTKEEGLEYMKSKYDVYADVTNELNPLPDRYDITYIDNDKVSELDYQLRQIDGITKVNNRFELATTLENFKSGIMLVFEMCIRDR